MYRLILIILFFSALACNAQDKIFFKNGTSRTGVVVSIAKDVVYFKNSDTSSVQTISKSNLLLIEKFNGTRYIFSGNKKPESMFSDEAKIDSSRNIFSLQPIGVLFGRATVAYERLSKDGKIGFVIPFSLTFNPFASGVLDTTTNSKTVRQKQGVSFITGLDVNFYLGNKKKTKFFMGPRLRYGTDIYLGEVEGYSLQTQIGWRRMRPDKRMVQHFSVGFGFVRVLSSPAGRLISPKQSYSWFSLNYRVGIKW